MRYIPVRFIAYVMTAALAVALSAPASAQERGGNFLDNLFNRGEQQNTPQQQDRAPQAAANDASELTVRIDRLENALRQLTGTIEQLQYRNQQLEQQVRALQGGGAMAAPQGQSPQIQQPPVQRPGAPAGTPGRRSDVFDPSQNPDAPGAPRTLGSASAPSIVQNEPPVGAPNGRGAGQPLDLGTLTGNASQPSTPAAPDAAAVATATPANNLPPVMAAPATPPRPAQASQPPRPAGAQVATLPPSASPQDEYDLAYGYVLHKDYAQAETSFRDFLRKHPNERLVPDAQYWLGESLYQRQRYRDAAEAFLAVSTRHEKAGKAPDSLLRLGQSLAALNQKEAACATLAEVARKYPQASGSVKRSVAQEIKRVRC
jgi:tol-pal system protein YbgF